MKGGVSLKIDMWYGDPIKPKQYGADAYFSDSDCVYRGNIYRLSDGKVVGDYESSDSQEIDAMFLIHWNE